MSILNISSIEKAVRLDFLEPHDIFNSTRKTIIERLKKDGSLEGGERWNGREYYMLRFLRK